MSKNLTKHDIEKLAMLFDHLSTIARLAVASADKIAAEKNEFIDTIECIKDQVQDTLYEEDEE